MARRYVAPTFTPVEGVISHAEGLEIGPTVYDQPVRQMTDAELRNLLISLAMKSEAAQNRGEEKNAGYIGKQAKKVQLEIERRSRLRNVRVL